MKKLLIALPFISLNCFALNDFQKNDLCNQAGFYYNQVDMVGISGQFDDPLETPDPSYSEVNASFRIKGHQNHYVSWESGDWPEYKTTRDFAFGLAFNSGLLQPARNFSSDENFDHIFSSRGVHHVVAIAKDDLVKEGDDDFGFPEMFIPLCEVSSIFVHNKPTLSVASQSTSNKIRISLNGNVDSLSKAAQNSNVSPTYRYRFWNEITGRTESLDTSLSTISYSPRDNGPYQVRVSLFDGTLSSTQITIVTGYYTGGSDCNSCDDTQPY